MSRNTNKDYYEDQIEETEKVIMSAIDMQEMIDQKLENEPQKGTISHRGWKKDINSLMVEYNSTYGKIYTLRR